MRKISYMFKGVLLGTLIVVCLCGCRTDTADYVDFPDTEIIETPENQSQPETEVESIYVYICGQVANPGVYILPEGSRVCDAFVMAGGFTKKAATDYWNQARLLVDGEMIYVPTVEEVKDRQLNGDSGSSQTVDTDGRVNINTASKEELMTIPGVGEVRASAILTYRQKNGPFSTIEEIKNVEGIKDGVYAKMRDYIKIN